MPDLNRQFEKEARQIDEKSTHLQQSAQIQKALGLAATALGGAGLVGTGVAVLPLAVGLGVWGLGIFREARATGKIMPIPWVQKDAVAMAAKSIQSAHPGNAIALTTYDYLDTDLKAEFILRTTLAPLMLELLEGKSDDQQALTMSAAKRTLIKTQPDIIEDPEMMAGALHGSLLGFQGSFAKLLPDDIKQGVSSKFLEAATEPTELKDMYVEIDEPISLPPSQATGHVGQETRLGAIDVQAVEAPKIQMYDLKDIAGENHTAIIGPSGSGKSYIAQYLIATYFPKDSNIIALDSDASPDEWKGLKVVGRGMKLNAIEGQMATDLRILQARTGKRAAGQYVGREEVRIVEEFPTLSAALSDRTKEYNLSCEKEDRILNSPGIEWLKGMLRRGRKYKMKVVLVSQEFEVKSLGIDGEGNLRKAFTVIWLGASAFGKLDEIRDKDLRENLRFWLNQQERPALVESGGIWGACPIPNIETMPQMPVADQTAEVLDVEPITVVAQAVEATEASDDHSYEEAVVSTNTEFIPETKRTFMQVVSKIEAYLKANPNKETTAKSSLQGYNSSERSSLEVVVPAAWTYLSSMNPTSYIIRPGSDGQPRITYQSKPLTMLHE